jgi:hypothetical protein
MSNKIGYQSMADTYVTTSFKNVLPAAYQVWMQLNANPNKPVSSSDIDSQPELPPLGTEKLSQI